MCDIHIYIYVVLHTSSKTLASKTQLGLSSTGEWRGELRGNPRRLSPKPRPLWPTSFQSLWHKKPPKHLVFMKGSTVQRLDLWYFRRASLKWGDMRGILEVDLGFPSKIISQVASWIDLAPSNFLSNSRPSDPSDLERSWRLLQFDALVDEMIMRDVSDVLQEITKKRNGFMKRFPNMNQKKGWSSSAHWGRQQNQFPHFFWMVLSFSTKIS